MEKFVCQEIKGAFSPSNFCNNLANKHTHKVAFQTNVAHFCQVCQSEVCSKLNCGLSQTHRGAFASEFVSKLAPKT
jgi:hypothetical protein